MFKRAILFVGLVLSLVMTNTALAQDSVTPQHSNAFWDVAYWNNTSLSGEPVVMGADAYIDWDWGFGSPHASVRADGFSARWSRIVDMPAGDYRFVATADDGIRVYVDGRRIIDEWYDHPAKTFYTEVSLSSGHHQVTVEYYENTGTALARVRWDSIQAPSDKWRGEYFNNARLEGSPTLVRYDERIEFYWDYGSPAAEIPSDGFSVRWTRTMNLEAGLYRFHVTTDDGVRLWVNDHLLIDNWRDQPFWSKFDTIYVAGAVPIKMEYYENTGKAGARLIWTRVDDPSTDGVIVDDTDSGFVVGGLAAGWHTANEGYSGRLTWTRNNDWPRSNYNWARWYPDLTSGRYEVFVYIPERYSTTSNARYWVAHADGYTLRTVDQSANGNRWVSLGTYRFAGSDREYVSLSDATYESRLSRLIAFDAVKWVPR